jgi:SAM-dependent methyltransferase
MNEQHLQLCASAEWAEAVQQWILPWVLDGVDLGDDVVEIGPGPGLTTDVLATLVDRLTAVELNPELAAALAERMAERMAEPTTGPIVEVVRADAASTPFPGERFSGAVCLSMLHHVPSVEHQDRVLAEIHRILRPGGVLAGEDSLDSPDFRDLHVDDTCVPLDPSSLGERLAAVGFTDVEVDVNEYAVRFRARK